MGWLTEWIGGFSGEEVAEILDGAAAIIAASHGQPLPYEFYWGEEYAPEPESWGEILDRILGKLSGEEPEVTPEERPLPWIWIIGGIVLLVVILFLLKR